MEFITWTWSTLIIIANLAAIAIYFYSKYKLSYWKRRGVEELPDSHWLFGDFKKAVLFKSAPGWYLGQLHHKARRDTPLLGFYVFHKPCLLLRDPKIIKQILIKDFEVFSDRGFAGSTQKDSIGMRNLFGLKNPAWRYLRNKITPTLTSNKVKQMFPLMLETGEPMMKFLKDKTAGTKVAEVDAQELNYKYCTDIIASVALGTKMDSYSNPNTEFSEAESVYLSDMAFITWTWSTLSVIIIANLAAIAIYFYSKYKLSYWKRRGVEELPDSHWLFGDFKKAVLFKSGPGWYLGQLHHKARRDTPLLGFYVFHKPCLLLRDPKIIKQILIKDFEVFSDRGFAGNSQKDSIGMRNLFALKNPAWRYLRNKIPPTLTSNKVKQMFPLMLETSEPMMKFLKDKTAGTKVAEVDAQELNYKYCTDIIASVALGTKMDSYSNPNTEFSEAVMEFFHSFKRMVALISVFFMPELVDLVGSPLLFNSQFVRKVFWDAVEKREQSGQEKGDYIDSVILLKNGDQNPVYKFEGENLLFQSGMFFSGFESSSTTAAFTLMELARHKQHQDRARQEIREAISKHGWNYEAFNEMKFTDQCIFEGLRMHPPVSTIDRCAREDYQIPGTDILIEKGTTLYISLYGIQEDERFFEDPKVFDPHRFNDKVPEAYVPFGVGPRMCVGMKLGQVHVKVIIALILSQYELHQDPDSTPDLDPRSTFTAAVDGISIQFRKIEA